MSGWPVSVRMAGVCRMAGHCQYDRWLFGLPLLIRVACECPAGRCVSGWPVSVGWPVFVRMAGVCQDGRFLLSVGDANSNCTVMIGRI